MSEHNSLDQRQDTSAVSDAAKDALEVRFIPPNKDKEIHRLRTELAEAQAKCAETLAVLVEASVPITALLMVHGGPGDNYLSAELLVGFEEANKAIHEAIVGDNPGQQLLDVRDAARELVAKLRECEPHIASAFLTRWSHGTPYNGPTYGTALEKLEQALKEEPHAKF